LLTREREARVQHAVDGSVDRGTLHLHEVGQRVVEIEDDGSDHGRYSEPSKLGLLAGRTDRAAETDFAVVDANVEAAGGIGADPSFVGDRGAVPAVIRKWDEHSR